MKAKLTAIGSILLVALLAAAAEARAAFPGENGLIAIESDRDGDHDIYVVRPDGRLVAKLTRNEANDFSPVWSPDGRRIAFASDRDGDEEIYVMRADGAHVRQVTRNSGVGDFTPAWSPDGRWIAFASNRLGEGNHELFKIRPDGTGLTRLTFNEGGFDVANDDAEPSWSPDGSRIHYINNHVGTTDVYAIDADGDDVTQLTDTPLFDESFPRLSPNGRRLLYASVSFEVPWTVRVARADGSDPRVLRRGFFADWQRIDN